MQTLIIEKPSLAPLPKRLGWGFVTALFWVVWVYLWMPLVTLLFWLSGVRLFDRFIDQTVQTDWREFADLVAIYAVVISVMGGGLLVWARIEYMRFRHVNRRTKPVPVSVEEVAEYAGLPAAEMAQWAQARRIEAHHDNEGRVVGGVADHIDAALLDGMTMTSQETAVRAA